LGAILVNKLYSTIKNENDLLDTVCARLHKRLGSPKPSTDILHLRDEIGLEILATIEREMNQQASAFDTAPPDGTPSEKGEYVLQQALTMLKGMEGDGPDCNCDTCTARRNFVEQVGAWDAKGESLFAHIEEIVGGLEQNGIDVRPLTRALEDAGVPKQLLPTKKTIADQKDRIFH
jgi:hypothetical protein